MRRGCLAQLIPCESLANRSPCQRQSMRLFHGYILRAPLHANFDISPTHPYRIGWHKFITAVAVNG